MSSFEIIILAIALAMDALAVSIACGMCTNWASIPNALKTSLFFGGFQAVMPLLGYLIGYKLPFDITHLDHWIAFALLSFIGVHMIKESFHEDDKCKTNPFKTLPLLISAVATSIDALAAGLSIAFLKANIFLLVITTGIVTAILSFTGVKLGKNLGYIFENRVERISGLVLILVGIKILIEHMTA